MNNEELKMLEIARMYYLYGIIVDSIISHTLFIIIF